MKSRPETRKVYYNEFDPYAAQWMRNLISAGHIADGDVDERSITDVSPEDVAGYTQCHFFAGIGGWSHALRLAGWADDRPVWTGSCPCQPFSVAGSARGVADKRHLWPHWFNLIGKCRPGVVFGEQVEAAVDHAWLDNLQSDLEGEGYAVAAVSVPACSVGAPHIRQRLYFVAHTDSTRPQGWEGMPECKRELYSGTGSVADCGVCSDISDSFWGTADWIVCRDGKWRAVEPGAHPMAHGVSGRVGRLRAYGNAIVPQVAAEVIKAFMECRP